MAFITPIPLSSSRVSPPVTGMRQHVQWSRARPLRARNAPRMLVIDAGSVQDMEKILGSAEDALVVVDYSTEWCGPCKQIAPAFEEMSDKYTDVVFVKVMGDASPEANELMVKEGIRAVPAFHFWKNGEKLKAFTGARKEDVETTITSLK